MNLNQFQSALFCNDLNRSRFRVQTSTKTPCSRRFFLSFEFESPVFDHFFDCIHRALNNLGATMRLSERECSEGNVSTSPAAMRFTTASSSRRILDGEADIFTSYGLLSVREPRTRPRPERRCEGTPLVLQSAVFEMQWRSFFACIGLLFHVVSLSDGKRGDYRLAHDANSSNNASDALDWELHRLHGTINVAEFSNISMTSCAFPRPSPSQALLCVSLGSASSPGPSLLPAICVLFIQKAGFR